MDTTTNNNNTEDTATAVETETTTTSSVDVDTKNNEDVPLSESTTTTDDNKPSSEEKKEVEEEEEEEEEEQQVGHRNKNKVDIEDAIDNDEQLNGSIDKSQDASQDDKQEKADEELSTNGEIKEDVRGIEEDIFGSEKEEDEEGDKPRFTRLSKRRERKVEKIQDNDDDLDLDNQEEESEQEVEEKEDKKKKKKKDKDGDYVVEDEDEEEEDDKNNEEEKDSDDGKKKKKKKSKKEKKEKKEKKRKHSSDKEKEPKKKKERSSKKKKDPIDGEEFIDEKEKEADPLQEVLDSLKHRRATKLEADDIKYMSREIIDKMLDAAERDIDANRQRQPALNKILLLAEVERVLSKVQLYEYLCFTATPSIFMVISQWLEPLPDGSQPNLKIKTSLLRILTQLPANREVIKGTGIVRLIQALQNNDNETPQIKKLSYDVIHKWSAPGESSREDNRFDEVEVDMDAVKKAAADEGLTKKFTKEDYLPKHIKHASSIPRSTTNYTIRPKGLDPKSNIPISSPLRTINRIDREIEKKRLKQPARGSPRAHSVSVEGRGLNLM